MGIKKKSPTIDLLIKHWKNQNIDIASKSIYEIEKCIKQNRIVLPNDFKELYSVVNGMKNFYPNEIDEEGFLFYPVEYIISAEEEFENSKLINKNNIYIFAEYMHKSWWYGFEIVNENNYRIGILATRDTFKPITNSLIEFLELYIEDSPILYDY